MSCARNNIQRSGLAFDGDDLQILRKSCAAHKDETFLNIGFRRTKLILVCAFVISFISAIFLSLSLETLQVTPIDHRFGKYTGHRHNILSRLKAEIALVPNKDNEKHSGLNATRVLKTKNIESSHDSIQSEDEQVKSFFLTACTMVKNEVPYIVEWIEFNRLQGVDRFIIYDGDSSDNITYLNEFYQQEDPGSHIHVQKSLDGDVHEKQRLNFQNCLDNYGNSTQWMMNVDVDEYLYSPAFGTIESMLRNLTVTGRNRNLTFNAITSFNLNFGSSGQQFRFENRLTRMADGSTAHQNGCGQQLITDHIRRGPAAISNGQEAYLHLSDLTKGLWICDLPGLFSPCRHNPGKTIFRPPDVESAGVHVPQRMRRRGDTINWDPPLLVGNHYYYRSREDVQLKAAQWRGGLGLPDHVRNYNLTDSLLWNHTADDFLRRRWGGALARRMARLTRYQGPCVNGVGRGAT